MAIDNRLDSTDWVPLQQLHFDAATTDPNICSGNSSSDAVAKTISTWTFVCMTS